MELLKEGMEKFWADKMEADTRIKERKKRHQEIVKLFNSSQLTGITPIWHTSIEDIDLKQQRENLCDDLLEEGITIIEDVDIELLFNKMSSGNPDMFREKVLYNKDLIDWKISEALDKLDKRYKIDTPNNFSN